jgi:hypothetical protein
MRFPLLRRGRRAAKAVRNRRTEAALRIGGGNDSRGRSGAASQNSFQFVQSFKEVSSRGDGIERFRECNPRMNRGAGCGSTPFKVCEGRTIRGKERALRHIRREVRRYQHERHDWCVMRLSHARRLQWCAGTRRWRGCNDATVIGEGVLEIF